MANIENIRAKAAKVEEVREKIARAQSVVVFDYRGLSAQEVTDLRGDMRRAGVEYAVLKNHIVKRASLAAGIDESIGDMLKGPSAFAFGYDDPVSPAKVLKGAIAKYKKCEIKGGIINGAVSGADEMNTLADLPSREVLIARMLGSMMSPISALARVLDQIAQKAQPAAE